MKARVWRLTEGPGWEASVAEARPQVHRFDDNLLALRDALGIDPFGRGTHDLVERADPVRVATTRDEANGYRLVVFFRVDRAATSCELGWVVIEWL